MCCLCSAWLGTSLPLITCPHRALSSPPRCAAPLSCCSYPSKTLKDALVTPSVAQALSYCQPGCVQVAGIVSTLLTPLYLWFFMYHLQWGTVGAACSCASPQHLDIPAEDAGGYTLSADTRFAVMSRDVLAVQAKASSELVHMLDGTQVHIDDIHELRNADSLHLPATHKAAGHARRDLARAVRFYLVTDSMP